MAKEPKVGNFGGKDPEDALERKMKKVKVQPETKKAKEAKKKAEAKRIKSHTGVYVSTYDPENINLSKEQFIAKRKAQREQAKKIDAYAEKVEKGEV